MEKQENHLDDRVSLTAFAEMAGFPVELVRKELLEGETTDDTISMSKLRSFMLKYLDKTMIEGQS